ncbi:MAG: phosphoribosylglycinamide formyltransferase [Firmicutes bacterium]|jgi:phosphoribosylglycinamide formyltransferase-1|nr:phosphoribosylglycinamide formyltransferase [Candidatus Fermentithermobacillaceae bacterium]
MTGKKDKRISLGVLVSGRGTNLQAILDSCEKGDVSAEVRVVISNRPGVMALGRASAKGVPSVVIQPRDFGKWPECKDKYEEKIVEVLQSYEADLIVLAGYDRLVGETLLNAYPMKVINIHPALLPSFPGLNAQKQALEYGVKVSGATVFFVDLSVDGGPIILQDTCRVMDDDTVESLSDRILGIEHRILPGAISLVAEGRLRIEGRKVRILEQSQE